MRILQLVPYPLKPLTHGGQIRVHAIGEFLTGIGAQLYRIVVAPPGYPSYESVDLVVPVEELEQLVEGPLTYDLGLTLYLSRHREVVERLVELVPEVDFIFLEQPWLFPIAEKVLEKHPNSRLVYSSQNVEFLAKESLYRGEGVLGKEPFQRNLEQIEQLEGQVVERAHWVVAVTPEDLSIFRRLGATNGVVAPNGTYPKEVNWEVVEEYRRKLEGLRFLLFVGSNYPPNVRGFWEMVGDLCYLSPRECIGVAGRVGEILFQFLPEELELATELLAERIFRTGFISEEELTALYLLSNGVLIPILHGGGSNLKTAEALYFNRPIVSTPFGVRGVPSKLLSSETLRLAETPEEFQRQMEQLLSAPPPTPAPAQLQFNRELLWEETLRPLRQVVEQ